MGWTFTHHATRQDIIDKILRDWTRPHYAVVAHRSAGNQLWIVIEHTPDAQPLERFIACHLLAKERGYGWGSKDMTEHMGPCEHSCPLALLAMAQPAPTEPSSVEWRARVQTYHETTKRRRAFFKSLHVGQLVPFNPAVSHLRSRSSPCRPLSDNGKSDAIV